MTLAPAPRPAPSPSRRAVIVSLAEFRIARSVRALAASEAAPPAQPYPWAYVFTPPKS